LGLSGRYDFKGIQKAGRLAIKAALASTVWGAKIIGSPFVRIIDWLIDFSINWLANKGLIILNIGAFYVEGEFDQAAFDKALDEGLSQVKKNPNISPELGKAIDDKVKDAARRFFKYNT
jgi:hypothetical protein